MTITFQGLEMKVRQQQSTIDDLEARLELLADCLATGGEIYPPRGLQPQQFEIVRYLRWKSPNWVTRQQIVDFLYGLRAYCDQPHTSSIGTQICRIRQTLPTSVVIEGRKVYGYRLPKASAEAWDRLVSQ